MIFFHTKGETISLSLVDATSPTLSVDKSEIFWVEAVSLTNEEHKFIEATLNITLPPNECLESDLSSAFFSYNDVRCYRFTFTEVVEEELYSKQQMLLVANSDHIISITEQSSVTRIFQQFNLKSTKVGKLVLLRLLRCILFWMESQLKAVHRNLDTLSNEIFQKSGVSSDAKVVISSIGNNSELTSSLEDDLIRIQQNYKRICRRFQFDPDTDGIEVKSLLKYCAFLHGRIGILLNAMLGRINIEQNNIIKIFSVLAVVFTPPTLIASIYGMNFDYMPELHWVVGYPLSIFLMILTVVFFFWYFRRRGLL